MKKGNPSITVLTSLYRGEKYLKGYFEHLLNISNLEDVEVLLLHNEPTKVELQLVQDCSPPVGGHVRHIVIPERESYYKSLNRGARTASGQYIAIWNVDDIRLPDSLERQAQTLDENPDVTLTYGDITGIADYQLRDGKTTDYPEYRDHRAEFFRSYFGGCFPMWRKSIHQRAGYFDEQLFSGGDFDFWIRIVRISRLMKTAGILGYFLNEGKGLSTAGWRNAAERTLIELRYGIFDKINPVFLSFALRHYRVSRIFRDGVSYRIGEYFPGYAGYLLRRMALIPWGLIKYPFVYLIPEAAKIAYLSWTSGPRATTRQVLRLMGR